MPCRRKHNELRKLMSFFKRRQFCFGRITLIAVETDETISEFSNVIRGLRLHNEQIADRFLWGITHFISFVQVRRRIDKAEQIMYNL